MKMLFPAIFLSAAIALLLAAGCQTRPMSPGDYTFQCFFSEGVTDWDGTMTDDPCDPGAEDAICSAFTEVTKTKHASRTACTEACEDVRRGKWARHVLDGCASRVQQADILCERYCMQHYP